MEFGHLSHPPEPIRHRVPSTQKILRRALPKLTGSIFPAGTFLMATPWKFNMNIFGPSKTLVLQWIMMINKWRNLPK